MLTGLDEISENCIIIPVKIDLSKYNKLISLKKYKYLKLINYINLFFIYMSNKFIILILLIY